MRHSHRRTYSKLQMSFLVERPVEESGAKSPELACPRIWPLASERRVGECPKRDPELMEEGGGRISMLLDEADTSAGKEWNRTPPRR